MVRTAQKIDSLVAEDASMEAAIETVLETAEDRGVVEWSDVSDELTSGQWGRLIEKGILVDADGDGFVVDDPDGVRDALEDAEPADEEGDGGWSSWDKIALVGSLAFFVGYWDPSIRNQIGGVLDLVIGPIDAAMPFYLVILVLAVLTGLWSTLLQDRLTNLDGMSDYQEKQQELREREQRAKEQDDEEALDEIREEQMEMMTDQFGMMKQQFRSMPWIMLFTIPVFLWVYWQVLGVGVGDGSSTVIVMPLIGEVSSWQAGIIGPMQAWIFWYVLCSMSLSQFIRKSLNIQTSPT
ncbi:DUF106 domain-containing protein [Halapricum desulfuricans]|uniref:OxaA/SpoJ/YidC translocase/secretase, sec-independent itegration of nascent memrane proteins into membrane n=1 Tax=Halapricum desulfuricans TaxID=2841257 RepID=A0A897NM45_9EURY|nr:DUF106 domain-containing protein [Halapricum desulfuricans]QSG09614.1 OxaA/SpoJ/YidC translocase/secretase, sec-independent itegration of nascent memrane proteins into membrane [Halapricum desulfuricans]QSG11286.1 OxaA/SpoJ/YidC translocase/secretase, sec-independent itegration of nascent memrane proteins into membrane [Halapricum desulfuricans]